MKSTLIQSYLTYTLTLLIILLVATSGIYGQERAIHRQIMVFIAPDSLELPTEKHQVESITEIQFSSKRLQNTFRTFAFEKIYKTFPDQEVSEQTYQNEFGVTIKKPNWNRLFTIQLPNENAIKGVLERLEKEPSILFAERNSNMQLHTDPLYPQQWHLNNTGQSFGTPDADIDAPEAWQIYTGSSSVKLAIIDTGVETSHDDLSGKSSGDIPESYPYNGYSHGTHVAGIAGAKLGGGDVRGVDNGVQIISAKVFSGYRYDLNRQEDVPNWAGDNTAYSKNNQCS